MTIHTGYRYPHALALKAAEGLLQRWGDTCQQIEIAGSIRRGVPSVKDIEIVVAPIINEVPVAAVAGQMDLFGNVTGGKPASVERMSQLDVLLEDLALRGEIFKERPHTGQKGLWGPKQKKFWIKVAHASGTGYLPIDLFVVLPPAQWGAIFTIRTGPADFSEILMNYINAKTEFRQMDGRLIVRETGIELQTPTEQAYFKVLGLPWVPPEKRTGEWVQKHMRMRRTLVRYQPPEAKESVLSGNVTRYEEGSQGKSASTQPAGEESAPAAPGESNCTSPQPAILSDRIKQALAIAPGLHRTVLIRRLSCTVEDFDSAMWALKHLKIVRENHYGGYWLIERGAAEVQDIHEPDDTDEYNHEWRLAIRLAVAAADGDV